ncbi:MAG: hypothetical protein MUO67_07995 [Anaerolineales bacterium]|nr:hypothetical protein [Anaerolineales bacterium]
MFEDIKMIFSGYTNYRSQGQFAFIMHRIAGLATIVFLTFHILTTATVFFFPSWYDRLVSMFRNPVIMIVEIFLAFFVIYHGVNGLRIAYLDLFRPDLWAKAATRKYMNIVFIVTILLWLPALGIMGYYLLVHGFGLFGAG